MYTLVFVTLVISLIGLYTQALALQTARMFAGQTTVADNMVVWHQTAVAVARYAVNPGGTNNPSAAGCSLTVSFPGAPTLPTHNGTLPALCTMQGTPNMAIVTLGPSTTSCAGHPPASTPCFTWLPLGYRNSPYSFNSIYYRAGNPLLKYVITWVRPPVASAGNPEPAYIYLPVLGTGIIPFTFSELQQQVSNVSLNPQFYGTVQTVGGVQQLYTGAVVSDGAGSVSDLRYPVPTGGVIPDGSLAIISNLGT